MQERAGRQAPTEGDADAQIEGVRQPRRLDALFREAVEKAPCEPNAPGGVQLEEELHAGPHTGNRDGERVVEVEGAKDGEPSLSTMTKPIGHEFAGGEEGDGTEATEEGLARQAEHEIAAGRARPREGPELNGRVHRSRSGRLLLRMVLERSVVFALAAGAQSQSRTERPWRPLGGSMWVAQS